MYARPADTDTDTPWEQHARGTLAPEEQAPAAPSADLSVWPPHGAETVADGGHYEGFAEAGFDYGPSFQGLGRVWRRGDEVFAEVALPEEYRADAPASASTPPCWTRRPTRFSSNSPAAPGSRRSRCCPSRGAA